MHVVESLPTPMLPLRAYVDDNRDWYSPASPIWTELSRVEQAPEEEEGPPCYCCSCQEEQCLGPRIRTYVDDNQDWSSPASPTWTGLSQVEQAPEEEEGPPCYCCSCQKEQYLGPKIRTTALVNPYKNPSAIYKPIVRSSNWESGTIQDILNRRPSENLDVYSVWTGASTEEAEILFELHEIFGPCLESTLTTNTTENAANKIWGTQVVNFGCLVQLLLKHLHHASAQSTNSLNELILLFLSSQDCFQAVKNTKDAWCNTFMSICDGIDATVNVSPVQDQKQFSIRIDILEDYLEFAGLNPLLCEGDEMILVPTYHHGGAALRKGPGTKITYTASVPWLGWDQHCFSGRVPRLTELHVVKMVAGNYALLAPIIITATRIERHSSSSVGFSRTLYARITLRISTWHQFSGHFQSCRLLPPHTTLGRSFASTPYDLDRAAQEHHADYECTKAIWDTLGLYAYKDTDTWAPEITQPGKADATDVYKLSYSLPPSERGPSAAEQLSEDEGADEDSKVVASAPSDDNNGISASASEDGADEDSQFVDSASDGGNGISASASEDGADESQCIDMLGQRSPRETKGSTGKGTFLNSPNSVDAHNPVYRKAPYGLFTPADSDRSTLDGGCEVPEKEPAARERDGTRPPDILDHPSGDEKLDAEERQGLVDALRVENQLRRKHGSEYTLGMLSDADLELYDDDLDTNDAESDAPEMNPIVKQQSSNIKPTTFLVAASEMASPVRASPTGLVPYSIDLLVDCGFDGNWIDGAPAALWEKQMKAMRSGGWVERQRFVAGKWGSWTFR